METRYNQAHPSRDHNIQEFCSGIPISFDHFPLNFSPFSFSVTPIRVQQADLALFTFHLRPTAQFATHSEIVPSPTTVRLHVYKYSSRFLFPRRMAQDKLASGKKKAQ